MAHTWKSLASNIHPPLPVSPRESQRLLSLLNASFKRQLDREHLAHSSSNEHYANLHLQSILTNPLFDAKPRARASSGNRSQGHGKRLEQLQDHVKRPMEAFKERVSQGLTDLGTAKFFLYSQYKDCLASPAATLREAMQSSGAASTMLQWLWSSGMEETGSFIKDTEFVLRLVPFLVADGQQSRILRWLQRCYSPEETPFSSLHGLDTYRMQDFLFERLITEELRFGDGLEFAITLFIQAVADLPSSKSSERSMRSCGRRAAWVLTKAILRLPKPAELEPSIVRRFMETTRRFYTDPLLNATICIYIQKRPNPKPALTYFQNLSANAISKMSAKLQPHLILLGLRAAELFLQEDCQTEALWIMEFLQTNFGEELGSPLPRIHRVYRGVDGSSAPLRSEEKSLHLLDMLTAQ